MKLLPLLLLSLFILTPASKAGSYVYQPIFTDTNDDILALEELAQIGENLTTRLINGLPLGTNYEIELVRSQNGKMPDFTFLILLPKTATDEDVNQVEQALRPNPKGPAFHAEIKKRLDKIQDDLPKIFRLRDEINAKAKPEKLSIKDKILLEVYQKKIQQITSGSGYRYCYNIEVKIRKN